MQQRAVAHGDTRREDIAGLERRIADFNGSREELGALTRQLHEFYGPIDVMFGELKLRIEQIPTDAQRARVQASAAPRTTDAPQESSARSEKSPVDD